MEQKRGWYFPDNKGGQDEGFENQGINQFKRSPYGQLAREIIQNSYDARIKEENKKVKVEFKLIKMPKEKIPNIESIQQNINASAEYFAESEVERLEQFRKVANEKMEKDTIDVLKISDYNTTGLIGIEKRGKSAWYGLIKSSGNSPKKGVSGGSYGSGKHAPFVFSYFRTIFYGTYVKDEGYAFQGKSILCAHKENGVVKGNIGYWGEITQDECKPIRNANLMDEFYRRNQTGTDLYIIGAKLQKEQWIENITYSVIENFWKLIIEDKLEVSIIYDEEEMKIDSKNVKVLAKYGNDINFKIDGHDSFNAYKFMELDEKIKEIKYGSICSENDVELKIATLPQYPEKKILKMRDTQMKINILIPRKRPVNFIGILTATGEELNKQLRESEPQTHDDWSADYVENEELKKEVSRTIKKLDNWLNEQINSLYSVENIEEFDPEGLDFLNIEEDDGDSIEEIQKPFDKIENQEEKEQEILVIQRSATKASIINKTIEEEANVDIGTLDIEPDPDPIPSPPNPEPNPQPILDPDKIISGDKYHEKKMLYIKTPYDSEKNMYRVIIKTVEDLKNVDIHFLRYTDSGELEKLKVKKAFLEGKELEFSNNIVKHIDLESNKETQIEVLFEAKRKCIMEVRVYVQS